MRHRRRVFSAPFVVTVIGASAAVVSCSGPTQPSPPHHNPGPPTGNPDPAPGSGSSDPTVGSAAGSADQVPTDPGGYTTEPPAKQAGETRWNVRRLDDAGGCSAALQVECRPPATPGGVRPTCNPPAPVKYVCPDEMTVGQPFVISKLANATECFVVPGAMTCPPNAICNPPPPRKVTCPSR